MIGWWKARCLGSWNGELGHAVLSYNLVFLVEGFSKLRFWWGQGDLPPLIWSNNAGDWKWLVYLSSASQVFIWLGYGTLVEWRTRIYTFIYIIGTHVFTNENEKCVGFYSGFIAYSWIYLIFLEYYNKL